MATLTKEEKAKKAAERKAKAAAKREAYRNNAAGKAADQTAKANTDTQLSIFHEYIESGSKLDSFSSLFSKFNNLGLVKNIMTLLNNAKSLWNKIVGGYNNLLSSTYLSDMLKKLGLTDKSLSLLNKLTGGLVSAADGAIGSTLSTGMSFVESYAKDLLSEALANVYMPEKWVLDTIKGLYNIGSDPNYQGTLREMCLKHDLADIYEWLDDTNGTTYSIDETSALSYINSAANYGSFKIVKYAMGKMQTSYNEISNSAATTENEKSIKAEKLYKYLYWFGTTFKDTIVYSYGDFKADKLNDFFDDIKPLKAIWLGTTDTELFKAACFTSDDIDIIAPLYTTSFFAPQTSNTEDSRNITYLNGNTQKYKTYIIPRNKNIKSIYIILANRNPNPMVNEALYERLKYPLYTKLINATDNASKVFSNSPLGKYIDKVCKQLNPVPYISETITALEPTLYNPASYNLLGYVSDDVEIPELTITTTTTSPTTDTSTTPTLPAIFTTLGLTYDDFGVILIPANLSLYEMSKKTLALSSNNSALVSSMLRDVTIVDKTTLAESTENAIILYTSKFDPEAANTKDRVDEILNYVLAYYLITYTVTHNESATSELGASTYNELLAKYNSLQTELASLKSYYDALKKEYDSASTSNTPNEYGGTSINGTYYNFSDMSFYKTIIGANGYKYAITEAGIVVYDENGSQISILTSGNGLAGTPEGIAIVDGALVVVCLKNGKYVISISTNGGSSFVTNNTIKDDASGLTLYEGIGISDISNLIFYSSILYGNYIVSIINSSDGNSLKVTKIKNTSSASTTIGTISASTTNASEFPTTGTIIGLSILANKKIYILSNDLGVYELSFSSLDPITIIKLVRIGDYKSTYKTSSAIGTIENAASNTSAADYDIDITDPYVTAMILRYYANKRLMYWILVRTNSGNTEIHTKEKSYEYAQSASFKDYIDNSSSNDKVTSEDKVINLNDNYSESYSFEKYLETGSL